MLYLLIMQIEIKELMVYGELVVKFYMLATLTELRLCNLNNLLSSLAKYIRRLKPALLSERNKNYS